MDNWTFVRFENAPIEIIDGDRGVNYPKQSDFLVNGHCLFLNAGNVTNQGFNFSNCSFINEEKDKKLRKGKLTRQDIVLTTRGTVGNVAFYDVSIPFQHIRINSGMVIFRSDTSVLFPRFLYFFLRSQLFLEQMKALSTGSAQPQLPIKDIKRVEISIPPIPEQRAIADVLGALDDKIELNRRMNETLEGLARALFERMKDEGGRMNGWKAGKLGDVAEINKRSINKDYPHAIIEYIDISSVSTGKLEATTSYELNGAPSRAKRLVKHGDTIWSTVRPNRKSFLFISEPKENLVVSTGFAVLTPTKVSPSYLYMWTTTDEFVDYLVANADGSAYPAVLPERFADAEILIPPAEILEDFESVAGVMLAKISQNDRESRTLAALRDALLPRLMSGEVRVKDKG